MANSTFWHDLATQFWDLRAKIAVIVIDGRWQRNNGRSSNETDSAWKARQQFHERFESLAKRGAIAAGIKDADVDDWLNLLRRDSPHFDCMEGSVPGEGGAINDAALASAEYCMHRKTLAFTAADVDTARPGRKPRCPVNGEKLKRYRERCKMSQEELAEKLDVNPSTVQRGESGRAWEEDNFIGAAEVLTGLLNERVTPENLKLPQKLQK